MTHLQKKVLFSSSQNDGDSPTKAPSPFSEKINAWYSTDNPFCNQPKIHQNKICLTEMTFSCDDYQDDDYFDSDDSNLVTTMTFIFLF